MSVQQNVSQFLFNIVILTKVIQTGTLELINLCDDKKECIGSTKENVLKILLNTFACNQIPLENFVGFTADGSSDIMGEYR